MHCIQENAIIILKCSITYVEEHNKACTYLFVLDKKSKLESILCHLFIYANIIIRHWMVRAIYTVVLCEIDNPGIFQSWWFQKLGGKLGCLENKGRHCDT